MNQFEPIPEYSDDEAAAAVRRNDPAQLLLVVLSIALYSQDRQFAEELCATLSAHADEVVRGNSILGFGHLARRFRVSNESKVRSLVEVGLHDPSQYVRGQAWAAADDITHFLGWAIAGFDP